MREVIRQFVHDRISQFRQELAVEIEKQLGPTGRAELKVTFNLAIIEAPRVVVNAGLNTNFKRNYIGASCKELLSIEQIERLLQVDLKAWERTVVLAFKNNGNNEITISHLHHLTVPPSSNGIVCLNRTLRPYFAACYSSRKLTTGNYQSTPYRLFQT